MGLDQGSLEGGTSKNRDDRIGKSNRLNMCLDPGGVWKRREDNRKHKGMDPSHARLQSGHTSILDMVE